MGADDLLGVLVDRGELEDAIAMGALVAARLAPLTIAAPVLVTRGAPATLRAALVVALTLTLHPLALLHASAAPPAGALALALGIVREAIIGLCFAVAIGLPFHAAHWAGRTMDAARGAGLSEAIDPIGAERSSPLGTFHLLLFLALFASAGGPRVALEAMAETFVALPVGAAIAPGAEAFVLSVARLVTGAFALAVMLAAPVLASLFALEITLGLLGRSAPTIPVFFTGMPMRAGVALGVLALTLPLQLAHAGALFGSALEAATACVRLLGGG